MFTSPSCIFPFCPSLNTYQQLCTCLRKSPSALLNAVPCARFTLHCSLFWPRTWRGIQTLPWHCAPQIPDAKTVAGQSVWCLGRAPGPNPYTTHSTRPHHHLADGGVQHGQTRSKRFSCHRGQQNDSSFVQIERRWTKQGEPLALSARFFSIPLCAVWESYFFACYSSNRPIISTLALFFSDKGNRSHINLLWNSYKCLTKPH